MDLGLTMKLSDYITEFIASKLKVKYVFTITGGACAHLIDSIHRNKKIHYICVQHEQAGAMAAEAYARVTNNFGVAFATSGPGATNLITGMCCAWFDSIPVLYITGQVNTHESKGKLKVRQIGFQETDIVQIVKSITKFSIKVDNPKLIRYYIEKAVYLAKSGRPGPVLIDIPMNVQWAEIEPSKLKGFIPKSTPSRKKDEKLKKKVQAVLSLIKKTQRPILLLGGGIRLGNAIPETIEFVETLGFPVIVSWSGFDIIPHDHPQYIGQFGVYGNRAANFSIQNADLVISLGSRLDTRQIGGQSKTFAREAKKIMIDIDPAELKKHKGIIDIPIACNVKEFLSTFKKLWKKNEKPHIHSWIHKTKEWKIKYPSVLAQHTSKTDTVNPYLFIKTLASLLNPRSVVIADCGGNLTWTMQAFEIKGNQRVFSAMGNSPMGYSLPASIGASLALNKAPVVCIIGDGGLQINIQELQTALYYKLPIKLFILNNHSYGIIKQFQEIYFHNRAAAVDPQSGYSMPNFIKVAQAYGWETETIQNHDSLTTKIEKILKSPNPVLCDVLIKSDQKLTPKLTARKIGDRYISSPLEDMHPFLSREEFFKNMIVKPLSV